MSKKLSVGVVGSTVWVARGTVGFLGSDGILYWVDTQARKEFSGMSLRDGECFWLYAREDGYVVSVVSGSEITDAKDLAPVA
jgi:hypothetical protein